MYANKSLNKHKEKTGRTYEQLAEEFHVSRRTIARWISGEQEVPWWVDEIIRLKAI
jgi:hypothetical protein